MNTAVIRREWVGRTVDGRFPLLEYLGESGTSIVFRTEFDDTSKRAAIRLVPADLDDSQSPVNDWASAANLSHPHLMRVFASGQGEVDDIRVSYVVTECAEERLSEVIPERPLTPDEAREMLQPILGALEYLHGKGSIFGHLKPSDILVVEDQLKLPVDNIHSAGYSESDRELSIYDAPEAASGQVSPASDVWSLGVTLIEALTQHPPQWDRSSPSDPVVPQSVPQPFADIARRCLCLSPTDRITLEGIRRRLEGLPEKTPQAVQAPAAQKVEPPVQASQAPIDTSSQIAPVRAAAPARRRLPGFIAAAIVILIAFVLVRSRQSPGPPPNSNPPAVTQTPAPSTPAAVPQPQVPQSPAPHGSAARGEVADRVMPEVTADASRTIRGKVQVTIRVSVDAAGSVSGASIQSAGGSRYFAGKALDAAKEWRFRPAQVNGQPAASVWAIQFVFRQDGISSTVKQVSP